MPKPRPAWLKRHTAATVVGDIGALIVSAGLYAFWGDAPARTVLLAGALVVGLTLATLTAARVWDASVLGQGSLEFTRVQRGYVGAAVVVALLGSALELPESRPFVFGVLPIALVLSMAGRMLLRRRLHRRRRVGEAMTEVLAVGVPESVATLIERTRRASHHGWRISGICTPSGASSDGAASISGVPVVGDLSSVAVLAVEQGFDVVSIAPTPGWGPLRLQQLAWDLEGSRTELVVDPGLMEIAGPRLHAANVDGLPLLRLTHPSFAGYTRLLKGAIDRVLALVLVLVLMPVLVGIAFAVRADGGPVLFRQTRVGLSGQEFKMLKFRSMVVDAELRLAELRALNEGAGRLFKMRNDPRVTSVGRFIRKYSLDELPQLFNVLNGTMSLVGPRPPLPSEVAAYERAAARRLLVKPGITGLWQVSGRSDLSWDESVRLDLRYVENWTLALDARILLRTARAVISGGGAY